MAQPPPYTPGADFSAEESNNQTGRSTVRTSALDAELAAIEATLDALCANIAITQRDDGQIRDSMVKIHTLGDDVRALFSLYGATVRGAWLTATSYVKADVVTNGGVTYICAMNHVSGTFATDLAAVKWIALNSSQAVNHNFTPAAGIAATNVQAALEELGNQVGDGTGGMGFRNRIINGDMRIDQRNAGAAVVMTSGVTYSVDRWAGTEDSDGAATLDQIAVTDLAGFNAALRWTSTTADASLAASQYCAVYQSIEGLNVADLLWGTAYAQTVTISFRVRSSLTGTFGGSLRNGAANRSYPFTYSISSANTWETKTIAIAGDTSGTWLADTGIGVTLFFGMGVGSTLSGTAGAWAGANYLSATGAISVIGTLNATLDITGVQFEVGTVATPFERRNYAHELVACMRYYQKSPAIPVLAVTATDYNGGSWSFAAPMRMTPQISLLAGTNNFHDISIAFRNINTVVGAAATEVGCEVSGTCASTTFVRMAQLRPGALQATSEL